MTEQSVATDVIKCLIKLVMVVCVTALVSIAVVVVSFVSFLNQYEYTTETVTLDATTGPAIYQKSNEGGNCINGEGYCKNKENDEKGQ